MSLPSLADTLLVLVILIPGFLACSLFRWLSKYERKISDNQLVLWSLACSLLIYTIFAHYTGVSNIDEIRDTIFVPRHLISTLSMGVLFGGIPGIINRKLRENIRTDDCWEISMVEAGKTGSWVMVYTDDGHEYLGTLHYSGIGEEPREITIRRPTRIIRDDDGKVKREFDVGKEILFREDDVKRVVFFREV